MESILESIGGDEIVIDYVRHLWSARDGLVREKELYKRIRNKVETSQQCMTFITDLQSHAKIYCALSSPDHVFWQPYGDVARTYVFALNTLQTRESQPLLLAIASRFSERETTKALRLLVSCVVRSLVVSGRGGILEKQYTAIAKLIYDGKLKNEKEIRKKLIAIVPGDKVFKESFSTASSSNGKRVRYFLREIEKYINTEEPEWVPSASVDEVSLEHILPFSHSTNWPGFDEETHRAFVKRFGNLAILASADNSKIGNVGFEIKKEAFAASSFKMTSSIAQIAEWSPDSILKRQRQLAELAVGTWPLTGEPRKPFKRSKITVGRSKKSTKTLAPARNPKNSRKRVQKKAVKRKSE